MKIVVIGGTGLIGSKLVTKLREAGHDTVSASPESGVDTYTGKGLEQALEGAQVVVDVSNAPVLDDTAVDVFHTSSRNILTVETTAGVSHHVALSIVGIDRLPDSGYYRGKLAQEEAVKVAAVPYTILRATQFFEFLERIADSSALADVAVSEPVERHCGAGGPRTVPARRACPPRPRRQERPTPSDIRRACALLRYGVGLPLTHPR